MVIFLLWFSANHAHMLEERKPSLSRTKGKEGTLLSEGLQVAPMHSWAANWEKLSAGVHWCTRGNSSQRKQPRNVCQPLKSEGEGWGQAGGVRGGSHCLTLLVCVCGVPLPGITWFPIAPGLSEGSLHAGEAPV